MNEHVKPAAHEGEDEGPLELLPGTVRAQSIVLLLIFGLLLLFALYIAADAIIPITLAVVLSLLLSPVVARLARLKVPEPLGAAVVMAVLLGGLAWGIYGLSGSAAAWLDRAPESLAEIERKLKSIRGPVEKMQKATEEVEKLADGGAKPTPTVEVRQSSLGQFFVRNTTTLATQAVIVVVLLYFLLAAGDKFMRRFVRAMPTTGRKRRAVEIVRGVRADVSTYLATVTVINVCLGAATALALWLIGLPNPILFGTMMGLFNFVPYAGSITMFIIISLASLVAFDGLGDALLAPLAVLLLTGIEGNFLTPMLLGRRLTLNPAIVFISLVFWGWMWGVAGAFLAVPLLVVIKTTADHLEPLEGISIFLGRRDT